MTSTLATVRLGDLFQPVAGTLPAGVLTTDAISNSRQSFTNLAAYSWNDTPLRFNNQGQKWEPDVRIWIPGPQAYGGVKQVSTPRRITAAAVGFNNVAYPHIMEFEFVFTGQTLTFEFLNLGGDGTSAGYFSPEIQYGNDVQVYIEHGGRMWRAADLPKTTTRTDGSRSYRNIAFAAPVANRRIRFVCSAGFMQVSTEASSIIAPSPPRPFIIVDGDSYVESAQALTADSSTQWFTTSIIDYIFELTGFAVARRGQGGTGFFTNNLGLVFDDTIAVVTDAIKTISGPSRYGSASRMGWMTAAAAQQAAWGKAPFVNYPGEDFGQPPGLRPLVYLLMGTWNDASAGGVTKAQMYARAKAVYALIHGVDPLCTIAHVAPEPFDDTLFGSSVGPPTAGDKSDLHRQGQMQAVAESPRTHYINGFGPDLPTRWWTGAGPDPQSGHGGAQDVPSSSPQARLCSIHDGIHYTRVGGWHHANKIVDGLAEIRVPAVRVNGLG